MNLYRVLLGGFNVLTAVPIMTAAGVEKTLKLYGVDQELIFTRRCIGGRTTAD